MNNASFSFPNLDTKEIMNTNTLQIMEASEEENIVQLLKNTSLNYYVLFIYLELDLDKNFCSNENLAVAVLVPENYTVQCLEDIELTELELKVTLNLDQAIGRSFLEKKKDDLIELHDEVEKMEIDHFIICKEDMQMPLNMDQLSQWIEEKYLIYEKKSVAVSFYTYKQKMNAYNEKKYIKSLKSYRYIFKSNIKK